MTRSALIKIASDLYEEKNFNLAAATFKDAAIFIESKPSVEKQKRKEQKLLVEEEGSTYLTGWIERSEEYKNFVPTWDNQR